MTLQVRWAVQAIAFAASFNLSFQSQFYWSLFHGTWQKRPREFDHRMQWAVQAIAIGVSLLLSQITTEDQVL